MIVSDFLSNKLVTRLNYGLVDGKEVTKNRSYSNVKQDATLAALHGVATTINSLQVPAMEEVHRIQEDLLFNDGL
ncbi:MAG: DUF1659 domain-containing protein [Acetobacterium sp.]|uniref:DUF1659 domain-containing protein n=1 Tax=Acetobacterium sp. TaxID=1872094 RepID=UPI003242505F